VFCPSHIAVELVAWIEYCSSVVGRREVELVVVLASFYKRCAEVNREVVFRGFWMGVVRDVLVGLES
jgi:hypothetical protein